jgi:hypothetical protein
MQFLQPLSVCLLPSSLRITNTTVDHNYIVQHNPWESYSLSADQNITCLLWDLFITVFTKTATGLCRELENAVDILVPHSIQYYSHN